MVQERQRIDPAAFDEWVAEQPEEHLYELINGEIHKKDMVAKDEHGQVISEFIFFLLAHLRGNDIDGYVTSESSGYQFGAQRYIPDVALVLGQPLTKRAYSTNQPALIIEVISDPNNNDERDVLDDKREIYLDAQATYWETNMQKRYVDVYSPDGRYRRVRDILTLDALPGLEIPLAKVFRTPASE